MLSFEELKKFQPQKDTYFVFGNPIMHTLSPLLHNTYFKEEKMDCDYKAVLVKEDNLFEALDIVKPYAKGVNLTIPHKSAVMKYLDKIDEKAKMIGAVNTVLFKDNKSIGYNTDYYGIMETIKKMQFSLEDKSILIVGTGGVAKAILCVCCNYTEKIYVMGRTFEKSEKFCEGTCGIAISELTASTMKFDGLFNATPVGMGSESHGLSIKKEFIKNASFIYDCIYNPYMTNLLVYAQIYKKSYCNGLSMLVLQGLESQRIWGNTVEAKDVIIAFENLKLQSLRKKNKIKKNIVLIGYMGAGKTTTAIEIAKKTNRIYIDIDELIVELCKMSINEIFKTKGEEYFREIEKKVIKIVSTFNGVVISTGGGVILNEDNINALKKKGEIFFLRPHIEEIKYRLFLKEDRPVIRDKSKIEKIYYERLPLYEQYSDHIIAKNSFKESAGEIIEIVKAENL